MWFRLKRLSIVRDVVVGLFVFGVCSMIADLLADIGKNYIAASVRGIGLGIFFLVFIIDIALQHKGQILTVPLMFTEETDRAKSRGIFNRFIQSDKKLVDTTNILEGLTSIKSQDLIIHLNRPNPRNSHRIDDWNDAHKELLSGWEEIDRELKEKTFASEDCHYHIFPHIPLPLSFALGASVNLRRPLVLYHYQSDNYYRVIDLINPRDIFKEQGFKVPPPESVPDNLNDLPKGKKLIFHIIISSRHPEKFQAHIDHDDSINAALIYRSDLDPATDWLPYIQQIFKIANPILDNYKEVEICLICPSVIAFALGMAFSRKPFLKVCHYFDDDTYRPVYVLSEVERSKPPFS